MGLSFGLSAKNSSGKQQLVINKNPDNTVDFCLFGKYNEQNIQIDFDSLSQEEFDSFVDYVLLIKSKNLQ